jgi:hypothetical protein
VKSVDKRERRLSFACSLGSLVNVFLLLFFFAPIVT